MSIYKSIVPQKSRIPNNESSLSIYKERIETKYQHKGYKVCGFVGKWNGAHTKLIMNCPDHGNWSSTTINSLTNGNSCPKC